MEGEEAEPSLVESVFMVEEDEEEEEEEEMIEEVIEEIVNVIPGATIGEILP